MQTKYQTKPFECWQKAKELRLKQWRDIASAREQNKLLTTGFCVGVAPVVMGLGDDVEFMACEPLAASTLPDVTYTTQCFEAVESRGFARDLCGYARTYWGNVFLNRLPLGGEFPRFDFIFERHWCDTLVKQLQVVSEYQGVPYHCVDFPIGPAEGERLELKVKYVTAQLHKAIEWMEKTTGRTWDDEKFLQAFKNEVISRILWAEALYVNRAIPAPMDQKSMYPFFAITMMMPWKQESVDFHRALLDEVRDRAAHRIAAVPSERYRLIHEQIPPWHFLRLFRILENYGVVAMGSHHCILIPGDFRETEEEVVPAVIPPQFNTGFKNRDEALQVYARWYLESPLDKFYLSAQDRSRLITKFARTWKVNGVILPINRGCTFGGMGILETKLALREIGIPSVEYEANLVDPRDFDAARVMDIIESFLDGQGLKPLSV